MAINIIGFEKGVAASPFTGFASMVGCDIFRKPGIIQNGQGLVQQSGIAFTGLINAQIISPVGDYYYGTSDGKFYKNTTLIATTTGGSAIHDLVLIQNYVVISKANTTLDLYNIGGAAYINDWKTGLNTSIYGYKKLIAGLDNVLYVANEGAIASQPGLNTPLSTTPGAILNTSALTNGLPTNRIIQTMCEQNRYLVMVTSFGDGSTGKTRVYFMDRFSKDAAGLSPNLSIGVDIPENKINQIINQNNRLILFGSSTGTFYTTNSTSYSPIAMIPNRNIGQSYITNPNGVCLLNNEVLFGIGINAVYTGQNQSLQGVFSLQGSSIIIKAINSTGNIDLGVFNCGSIVVTSQDEFQIGYTNTINGVTVYIYDKTLGTLAGSNNDCFFESAMYDTGTALVPKKFQRLQLNLANNLVAGQVINISYRTATNASYAGTKTLTFAKYGSVNSIWIPFPTENTTNIQIKVYMNCGSAVSPNEIQIQSITIE